MAIDRTRWFVLAALLVACSPPLVDGAYGCPDGRCPAGWFCHPDALCRALPPSAPDGGADTPRTMGRALDPCGTGTDCMSGVCMLGRSLRWTRGYCSEACSGEVTCPGVHPGAVCSLEDVCEIYCEGGGECPRDFLCVGDFRDAGITSGSCYPPDAPIEIDGRTCSTDDDCGLDFVCAGPTGLRCVRPCGPGLSCAPTEVCRSTPRGEVCLPR